MKGKITLVLGASDNPSRYSYLAINKLVNKGYAVKAIGKRAVAVHGVNIITEHEHLKDIDTVTLYLNPSLQKQYYQYILDLKPRRIIFNPGTENDELEALAKENGIEAIEACTLVMLSTGQY